MSTLFRYSFTITEIDLVFADISNFK